MAPRGGCGGGVVVAVIAYAERWSSLLSAQVRQTVGGGGGGSPFPSLSADNLMVKS